MFDITCILSASLFFIGNILRLVYFNSFNNRSHVSRTLEHFFDPDYIQEEWDWRNARHTHWIVSQIIVSLAWLSFAFPVLSLTWIVSCRGTRSVSRHVAIVVLTFVASFTEFLGHLFYWGTARAQYKIVNHYNLDNWIGTDGTNRDGVGWRTLELVHIVLRGFTAFLDSVEWLCLFAIMLLLYFSVRDHQRSNPNTNVFGIAWNAIGLFISILALGDFIVDIMRLEGFRELRVVSIIFSAFHRLIALPAWFVILSFRLPVAEVQMKQDFKDEMSNFKMNDNATMPSLAVTGQESQVPGNDLFLSATSPPGHD